MKEGNQIQEPDLAYGKHYTYRDYLQFTFDELLRKKKLQYSLIYDLFGAETLDRWYKFYPKKYTRKKVHKLRKY